jgi:phospholipid-transporting ATPase
MDGVDYFDLTPYWFVQYDSDEDDDLAVFSSGHQPASPYNNRASTSANRNRYNSNTTNPNPFSNATAGAYDSFEQSQNPASYGGGQAAGPYGTAPGAQRAYDDPYNDSA